MSVKLIPLEDRSEKLLCFDDTGLLSVDESLTRRTIVAPNPERYFQQPKLEGQELEKRLSRFVKHLDPECFNVESTNSFAVSAAMLREQLERDKCFCNLLQGPCLPLLIPRLWDDQLASILYSLSKTIAGITGLNMNGFRRDQIMCDEIAPVGRTDELIDMLLHEQVFGLFFPSALQGLSVAASREVVEFLPEGFFLGGIDVFVAAAMYPDIMFREQIMPSVKMAGLEYVHQKRYLDICASSYRDTFTRILLSCSHRTDLAFPHSGSGLLYIG